MTCTPTHLARWTLPKCYAGADWYDYYSAGVGQSRDSDALERSNFAVMIRELEAIPEPPAWEHDEAPWIVVRENHWAVGWVEWIAIHKDAEAHLQRADELQTRLADYPILDEMHYGEVENTECEEVWNGCFDRRERVRYLRQHAHTGDFRALLAAARGSWYDAANVLHSPSDILC